MLATMTEPGKPGRPLIGPKAQAHIDQQIFDAVKAEAKTRKVTRSEVWREIIVAGYLARRGGQ